MSWPPHPKGPRALALAHVFLVPTSHSCCMLQSFPNLLYLKHVTANAPLVQGSPLWQPQIPPRIENAGYYPQKHRKATSKSEASASKRGLWCHSHSSLSMGQSPSLTAFGLSSHKPVYLASRTTADASCKLEGAGQWEACHCCRL